MQQPDLADIFIDVVGDRPNGDDYIPVKSKNFGFDNINRPQTSTGFHNFFPRKNPQH
jgi:hypothetical protein